MKMKITPKFKVGQTVEVKGDGVWVISDITILVNNGIHILYSLARYAKAIIVDDENNGYDYKMDIDGRAWLDENELQETNKVYNYEVYDEEENDNYYEDDDY